MYAKTTVLIEPWFSVCASNDKRRVDHVKNNADRALDPADLFAPRREKIDDEGDYRKESGVGEEFTIDAERRDRSRDAEDEEDVEKAGADGVSDCDARLAFLRRDKRGDKLGKGSAEGNDGQPDQRFAHSEVGGDQFCVIDNDVTANHNGKESAYHVKRAQKPRKLLPAARVDRISKCFSDDEKQIHGKRGKEKCRFIAFDHAVDDGNCKRARRENVHGHIAFYYVALGGKRDSERGDPDDGQKVEKIRADDVSERDGTFSADACGNADRRFGRARAEGNDRQPDDERGHAELRRDR